MNFSRSAKLAALSLLAVLVTACSNSNSIPAPMAPPTVTTTTTDPTGDAQTMAGGTAWDITQVATSRLASGATSLNVSVTFAQPISAASLPTAPPGTLSPAGTQLGMFILLDTGASGISLFPGAHCTGSPTFSNVAFFVGSGSGGTFGTRLSDGNYPILNASFAQVGEAVVSFTGPNTITYSIPLAAIGGGSGALQLAVFSVNGPGGSQTNVTDCAPNSTYITT